MLFWDGVIVDLWRVDGFVVVVFLMLMLFVVEVVEKQMEVVVMVQEFYVVINRCEIILIGDLFVDNCVYEDFVFLILFIGRQVIFIEWWCMQCIFL